MSFTRYPKLIAELQNKIYDDLEDALESHEKKMTYIGFAMLLIVVGSILVITWHEPLKNWLFIN